MNELACHGMDWTGWIMDEGMTDRIIEDSLVHHTKSSQQAPADCTAAAAAVAAAAAAAASLLKRSSTRPPVHTHLVMTPTPDREGVSERGRGQRESEETGASSPPPPKRVE